MLIKTNAVIDPDSGFTLVVWQAELKNSIFKASALLTSTH